MVSYVFVIIQFLCIWLIIVTGPIIPFNKILLVLELLGIGLGIWAILVMGIGKFNITPKLKRNSVLVSSGPYKFIRHPMYAALLVTTLALVIDLFTFFRIVIWLILIINLILKLNFEEKLLNQSFKAYAAYKKKSYKIIPFIY